MIPLEEKVTLGVKMFFMKSGLVSSFTTTRKCGIAALHTDLKALQEEISFTLISRDR